MTLRSPSRKYTSPNRSKISEMVNCAPASISASASTNGKPSFEANRLPTEVFPAPIMPTSTIERSPSAAAIRFASTGGR